MTKDADLPPNIEDDNTSDADKDSHHRKDLDAILQDMLNADDQPIEFDVQSRNSDMSSLLPFGNVIPSDCESSTGFNDFSRQNSEMDLERCGSALSLNPKGDVIRPNEVFLTPCAPSPHNNTFRPRKSSLKATGDTSVSSNESNSLSSLFDSMGWSKRKKRVHHSRGLNKKTGLLDKFFASKSSSYGDDRPHHSAQGEQAQKRGMILCGTVLFIMWLVLSSLPPLPDESYYKRPTMDETKRIEDHSPGRPEMESFLTNNGHGALSADNRPQSVKEYYDKAPRDDEGAIIAHKVPLPQQANFLSAPSSSSHGTPLFWIIPKSGGGAFRKVASNCYSLTLASDHGAAIANSDNKELQVVNGSTFKYINVETFSKNGIKNAKDLGLVSSKLADIIVSPLFQESLTLFDEDNSARAFTILRHPISRAARIYQSLSEANKLPLNEATGKSIGLESYARSQYVENNYMVRYLSGQVEGVVNEDNLKVAKEILKKFVIGLAENLDETLSRFEQYYSFTGEQGCRMQTLASRSEKDPKVKEGSLAWNLLQHQNKYDMKLYNYAQELYTKQGLKLFA